MNGAITGTKVGAILGMILLVLGTGCASQRFLTAEQDKELRDACEVKGCAIIPNDVLMEFLKMLEGVRS